MGRRRRAWQFLLPTLCGAHSAPLAGFLQNSPKATSSCDLRCRAPSGDAKRECETHYHPDCSEKTDRTISILDSELCGDPALQDVIS